MAKKQESLKSYSGNSPVVSLSTLRRLCIRWATQHRLYTVQKSTAHYIEICLVHNLDEFDVGLPHRSLVVTFPAFKTVLDGTVTTLVVLCPMKSQAFGDWADFEVQSEIKHMTGESTCNA